MKIEMLRETLYSGIWGTIGPRAQEAGSLLGERWGNGFGLLMHSGTAAYETALRSLGIGHGDLVLCPAGGQRMDGEIAAAIGATPVFRKGAQGSLPLSVEDCRASLADLRQVKAVGLDDTRGLDLPGMVQVCREGGCELILNMQDNLDRTEGWEGIYAAIFDLGVCGGAVTGREEIYRSLFAWHHCGHAPGTADSLSFDQILGGDMRVSEWQAIAAMEILKEVP